MWPFKKKKSPSQAMKESLESKPMFSYKMLEPFNVIDIDTVLERGEQEEYGKCRLLCENDRYQFYGFKPALLKLVSEEYVLRRSKEKNNDVVFWGESADISCIFCNHLFQVDRDLIGTNFLLCKNIDTGNLKKHYWFSEFGGYNGHFMSRDFVNEMYIYDKKLTLDVGRLNCDFHNKDEHFKNETDYILTVDLIGGEFVPTKVEVLRDKA
ncbi:MAG: hypothetical protein RR949_06515 [Oscillospiraceae bacterium]